jgi:hypothetical protein
MYQSRLRLRRPTRLSVPQAGRRPGAAWPTAWVAEVCLGAARTGTMRWVAPLRSPRCCWRPPRICRVQSGRTRRSRTHRPAPPALTAPPPTHPGTRACAPQPTTTHWASLPVQEEPQPTAHQQHPGVPVAAGRRACRAAGPGLTQPLRPVVLRVLSACCCLGPTRRDITLAILHTGPIYHISADLGSRGYG